YVAGCARCLGCLSWFRSFRGGWCAWVSAHAHRTTVVLQGQQPADNLHHVCDGVRHMSQPVIQVISVSQDNEQVADDGLHGGQPFISRMAISNRAMVNVVMGAPLCL